MLLKSCPKDDEHNKKTQATNKMENFFKFPRTSHLFSAGGMIPRDDLETDGANKKLFFSTSVTVEEKIDGSNLGLSIDPQTLQILAQNRSHYVNSQTHSQFKMLDAWIAEHAAKLFEILQPHYILYGECVQKKKM